MKKSFLLIFVLLAGCIDVTQYISFNDQGQSVISVRMEVAQAFLNENSNNPNLERIVPNFLPSPLKDTNIVLSRKMISNEISLGVEARFTGPKNYFSPGAQAFLPVKESNGFSVYFKDSFRDLGRDLGRDISSEMKDMENVLFWRYRIILSKASLPRPLKTVRLFYGEQVLEGVFHDYDKVYLIEVPLMPILLGAEKLEFRF